MKSTTIWKALTVLGSHGRCSLVINDINEGQLRKLHQRFRISHGFLVTGRRPQEDVSRSRNIGRLPQQA